MTVLAVTDRKPSLEEIRRIVAAPRDRKDPRERVLANVDGTLSPALRAVIDQPGRAASVLLTLIERPSDCTS